jgi:hypothetical protein
MPAILRFYISSWFFSSTFYRYTYYVCLCSNNPGNEIVANWKEKLFLSFHLWISGEFAFTLAVRSNIFLQFLHTCSLFLDNFLFSFVCDAYLSFYPFLVQLGAGTFVLHQTSILVNSILVSFGLSEEMHYPVSLSLLQSFIAYLQLQIQGNQCSRAIPATNTISPCKHSHIDTALNLLGT